MRPSDRSLHSLEVAELGPSGSSSSSAAWQEKGHRNILEKDVEASPRVILTVSDAHQTRSAERETETPLEVSLRYGNLPFVHSHSSL